MYWSDKLAQSFIVLMFKYNLLILSGVLVDGCREVSQGNSIHSLIPIVIIGNIVYFIVGCKSTHIIVTVV